MKNLVLTLTLIFAFTVGFGQNNFIGIGEDRGSKNEFGLNATGFVANYFNLGGVASNTPYLIDYKRELVPSLYFRSGLDFGFRNNNTSQQNGNRFYSNSRRVNLRIGVEKRKPLGSKFEWHYGIDAVGGLDFTQTSSNQQFFFNNDLVMVTAINGNESSLVGCAYRSGASSK